MEFIVEKFVDGEWYLWGVGPLEYVNNTIPFLVNSGTIFRLREVKNED